MNDLTSISLLPAADQAELQAELLEKVKGKLDNASQEAKTLREESLHIQNRLLVLDDAIQKYQVFISHSYGDRGLTTRQESDSPQKTSEPTNPEAVAQRELTQTKPIILKSQSFEGPYNKDWPRPQRLLYILRQPEKYGESTFVGARSVINAILQEEPELRQEGDELLMKRFGPALSHLAQKGQLLKFAEKGKPSRVHYLSPEWFEGDELRPEYHERLSGIELVAPEARVIIRTKKSVSSLEPLTEEKSPSVRAEEDTSAETGEVEPSVDAEKESSNGIMSLEETFQLR